LEQWAIATDVEYKTTAESFSYYRCARCEALSIHPVPIDRLRMIYPPNYYSFASGQRHWVDRVKETIDRRRFRSLLAQVRANRISALDVGGGAGHQLDLLRRADPRVAETTIIDMDEGAAHLAEAAGHRFILGRVEHTDLRETFDVVLLLNLIEHVIDPVAVLRQVASVLTTGGVVLVQTPNFDSLDARLFRHRNWGGYHCPRHFAIFNPSSFQRAVAAAGLSVRSWRYTQGAPFWTVSVLAGLDRAGVLRITQDRPAWLHPLYPPLAAAFAGLDFIRGGLMPLSQMVFVLGHSVSGDPDVASA
jgi:2-polyprenyl-3-methyl-5-hydroxy-6-metoxy-1,4-benzoquinol methylase